MAKVIIIGGGPAGCEAAHQLASQGIDVELVEKNNETGDVYKRQVLISSIDRLLTQ